MERSFTHEAYTDDLKANPGTLSSYSQSNATSDKFTGISVVV